MMSDVSARSNMRTLVGSPARLLALSALAFAMLSAPEQPATAAGSEWTKGHAHRVRLIAGPPPAEGERTFLAGIEVELQDGWKTYWRNPGDSGGMPPAFDWSQSRNVKVVQVSFPAPARIPDVSGDTIGYKRRLVLPITVEPADASKPVALDLALELGVCREICIPAEARLTLTLDRAAGGSSSASLLAALASVPRQADKLRSGDPALVSARLAAAAGPPRLEFEVDARDAAAAELDLFVEAPGDIYLPMAKRIGSQAAGRQRFELQLDQASDAQALRGKTLRLTMVSSRGASEADWRVE